MSLHRSTDLREGHRYRSHLLVPLVWAPDLIGAETCCICASVFLRFCEECSSLVPDHAYWMLSNVSSFDRPLGLVTGKLGFDGWIGIVRYDDDAHSWYGGCFYHPVKVRFRCIR